MLIWSAGATYHDLRSGQDDNHVVTKIQKAYLLLRNNYTDCYQLEPLGHPLHTEEDRVLLCPASLARTSTPDLLQG